MRTVQERMGASWWGLGLLDLALPSPSSSAGARSLDTNEELHSPLQKDLGRFPKVTSHREREDLGRTESQAWCSGLVPSASHWSASQGSGHCPIPDLSSLTDFPEVTPINPLPHQSIFFSPKKKTIPGDRSG